MTGDETTWPRDPHGHQFLLRTLDNVGRQSFPSEWTGKETLKPPYKMPDIRPALPKAHSHRKHPADLDEHYVRAGELLRLHDSVVRARIANFVGLIKATGKPVYDFPGLRIEASNWDPKKLHVSVDISDDDWARAVAIDQPRYNTEYESFRRAEHAIELLVRYFEAGRAATFYRSLVGGELHPIPADWWRGEVVDRRFDTGQLNPTNPFDQTQRGAYIFVRIADFREAQSVVKMKINAEATENEQALHHLPGDVATQKPVNDIKQSTLNANMPQKRKGRTPGSGSLKALDRPLLDEMKLLIESGAATSVENAARQLSARAASIGPVEQRSKQTRLAKRYREEFKS